MTRLESPPRVFAIREHIHRLFHRPEFHESVVDGVRAIAVLWVIIGHVVFFHSGKFSDEVGAIFKFPWTRWLFRADLGVDLFFVISGFLIGTILLRELQGRNAIGLRRFYGRRFLRLMPVYCVVMVMGVFFLYNVPKSAILKELPKWGNVEMVWTNLLYVNNFVTVSRQYMPWCWSLAIEEQFYLIIPVLLLVMVKRTRRPVRFMLVLLVLSGIIRLAIILWHGFVPPFVDSPDTLSWSLRFDTIYDKLHVRYAGLLCGVMTAYFSLYHREKLQRFFQHRWRSGILGITSFAIMAVVANVATVISWLAKAETPDVWRQLIFAYSRDVFSIATITLIPVGIFSVGITSGAVTRVLASRWLYPIAQLSYSMYLLHEMFMLWLFPRLAPFVSGYLGAYGAICVDGAIATVATVGGAAVLYVLVERPCLSMRESAWFRRLVENRDRQLAVPAEVAVEKA